MPERVAARLSLASGATFVALLAVLHVVKAELDPSWRFISEYAIGAHGWLMVLACARPASARVPGRVQLHPGRAPSGGGSRSG